MSTPMRPLFFFPAAIIGLALTIAFFKIYGPLSRPDVPAPVAQTVARVAPNVAIGKKVQDVKGLSQLQWVPHFGYVAHGSSASFPHVRLYVGPEEQDKPTANGDARIQAVEAVNVRDEMSYYIIDAAKAFRAPPLEGCIYSANGEAFRGVMYWKTRNDLGGIALIGAPTPGINRLMANQRVADVRAAATAAEQGTEPPKPYVSYPSYPQSTVWSLVAWNGPFNGAKTLHANFAARPCTAPGDTHVPDDVARTVAVSESLMAVIDPPPPSPAAIAAASAKPPPMDSVATFAEACFGTNLIHAESWTRRDLGALPFSSLVPPGYTAQGSESNAQRFVAPDGSELSFTRRADRRDLVDVPELGMETECEATVGGIPVHIETGRKRPELATKTTSASYRLTGGGWLVFSATAPTVERQREQLRVVRELRAR